jgi:hypothetical protein
VLPSSATYKKGSGSRRPTKSIYQPIAERSQLVSRQALNLCLNRRCRRRPNDQPNIVELAGGELMNDLQDSVLVEESAETAHCGYLSSRIYCPGVLPEPHVIGLVWA